MHIDDFPSELLQEIFRHLACIPAPEGYEPFWCDDHAVPCTEVIYSADERFAKHNLTLCSLVSRIWQANSKSLLFRTLALRFSPTSSATRTLQDIALWLEASGVRSFVQDFRLILTQPVAGDQIGVRWGEPLYYDANLLSQVLFSFTNLRTLKLVDVRLDRFSSQVDSAMIACRSVKRPKLDLESFHYIFNKCSPFCGLQSLPDLLYLMTWLGNVTDLYVGYVPLIFDDEHSATDLMRPKGFQVHNASIEGDHSIRLLINGLRDSLAVDFSALQSMSVLINVLGDDALEHIPPLFHMIAPYTDSLTVNMIGLLNLAHGGIHSRSESHVNFDLSRFINLRSLRLDIPVGHIQLSSPHYEALVWWYIAKISATASVLPLQEVNILLDFRGATSINSLVNACSSSITCIDGIMCRIPALKKFRLLKRGKTPSEAEDSVVAGAFEGLAARGVLQFGKTDDMAEVEHLCEIIPGLEVTAW